MIKKISITSLLMLIVFVFTTFGQQNTVINSNYAKNKLIGKHKVSLQWISWDYFGTAYVKDQNGVYSLKGTQKSSKGNDSLEIDGSITEINRYNFKFNGTITTQISHNNGGEPCVREGEMTFAITQNRKYWRLQEMQSPCENILDYVDIYFRR